MSNLEAGANLSAALIRNDLEMFRTLLRNLATEYGITKLSRVTKIPRPTLYNMLSKEGNPSFAAVQAVLRACGLSLQVVSVPKVNILASPRARYTVAARKKK